MYITYEGYTSNSLNSQSCGAAGHPNMEEKKTQKNSTRSIEYRGIYTNLHNLNNKLQMHWIRSAAVLPGTQIWGVKK